MKRTPLKRKTPLKAHKPIAKRSSRREDIDKADALWRKYIYLKFDNRCAMCNKLLISKSGTLLGEAHHLVRRRILHLRHDPMNGILLCTDHHTAGTASAHADEAGFINWMKVCLPDQYGWYLEHRYEDGKKPDMEEVLANLQRLIDGYARQA